MDWGGFFIFNNNFSYIEQITDYINSLLDAQEKGELPDAVKIYPNKADVAVLRQQNTMVKEPALPEAFTFVEGHDNMFEEMFPDLKINTDDITTFNLSVISALLFRDNNTEELRKKFINLERI